MRTPSYEHALFQLMRPTRQSGVAGGGLSRLGANATASTARSRFEAVLGQFAAAQESSRAALSTAATISTGLARPNTTSTPDPAATTTPPAATLPSQSPLPAASMSTPESSPVTLVSPSGSTASVTAASTTASQTTQPPQTYPSQAVSADDPAISAQSWQDFLHSNSGTWTDPTTIKRNVIENGHPIVTYDYSKDALPDTATVNAIQSMGYAIKIFDPSGQTSPVQVLPTDNFVAVAKANNITINAADGGANYILSKALIAAYVQGKSQADAVAAGQAALQAAGFTPAQIQAAIDGPTAGGAQTA